MKYLIAFVIITLPTIVFGQSYKPLVNFGIDPDADFNGYINNLYALSVSIAALLAVIKIVIAGVKYMLTDIAFSKSEAKKDIQGALLGLILILGAVLVITVINPKILEVNLSLTKVTPAKTTGGKTPATAEYAKQPGDQVFPVSAAQKAECETADPAACALKNNAIKCYDNDYYANDGIPVCVVRAGSLATKPTTNTEVVDSWLDRKLDEDSASYKEREALANAALAELEKNKSEGGSGGGIYGTGPGQIFVDVGQFPDGTAVPWDKTELTDQIAVINKMFPTRAPNLQNDEEWYFVWRVLNNAPISKADDNRSYWNLVMDNKEKQGCYTCFKRPENYIDQINAARKAGG